MTNCLQALLATKSVIIADGAMGTSLMALGFDSRGATELWNRDHPDQVRAVHAEFLAAGSDIILTNSFGANRMRLGSHGAADQVAALNGAAAALAREAADISDRPVLVAGSIGPTGKLPRPYGPLSDEEAYDVFTEQAAALVAGGVDLLWLETFAAIEELGAALAAAAQTGMPVVATMTFDTHGRTMMGVTPAKARHAIHDQPAPPAAFGANCGIGPAPLVDSLLGLAAASGPDDAIVAKSNCGVPTYRDGTVVYDGTPAVMGRYACLARDAGARVIGGCCGTTPEHIQAMVDALAAEPRAAAPDRAKIEMELGPLPAPPATARRARGARHRRSTSGS